jgi:hypothetical protein
LLFALHLLFASALLLLFTSAFTSVFCINFAFI